MYSLSTDNGDAQSSLSLNSVEDQGKSYDIRRANSLS